MDFHEGDIVAVHIPGLSRPLYGTVVYVDRAAKKIMVHVESERGETTITVDAAIVKPWKEDGR